MFITETDFIQLENEVYGVLNELEDMQDQIDDGIEKVIRLANRLKTIREVQSSEEEVG